MTPDEAFIALNLLPGIGPVRVKQLLEHFGCPEAILAEPQRSLSRFPGIGSKLAGAIASWRQTVDVAGEQARAATAGVDIVTLSSPAYPAALKEIYDPPLCLYVRGRMSVLEERADRMVAVVGSRRTSRYGVAVAESLVAGLVRTGWVVVSGLARGIDTVAHGTCVEHDGITVAVTGGGLGCIYPQENVPLAQRITEQGAVLSEQPMMMKPDRRTFPMRNRIIAGLARGVLVVEAGTRSGSLITAKQALEQGRLVFAVPGRVDSPQSRGCHQLIKDGAKLVETIDDMLEEFSFLPQLGPRDAAPADARPAATRPDLGPREMKIVAALRAGDLSVNDLVQETSLPVHEVLAELFSMELKRLVQQLPGQRFELRGEAAG